VIRRRAFVTGAGGLLGTALTSCLVDAGWEVVVALRTTTSAPAEAVQAYHWELRDPLKVDWLRGCEALIHLAAYIPPNLNDPGEAQDCFNANAAVIAPMIEACESAGVKQFVYPGAALAYAPGPAPATEEDALYPSVRAPYYLASKVAGEIISTYLGGRGAVGATVLRISSIYGPGMKKGGLIPNFARAAKRGEPLILSEGGTYAADFVLATDVASAILSAVERNCMGVFNIGGAYASTLELATRFIALSGGSPDQIQVQPSTLGATPTALRAISIERASAALGYQPTPLDVALRLMLDAA
jgi:UDP-glucose 4-epimerase